MVSELLTDAVLGIGDLQGIAFGAGPGSFTGLRIACAVAQGLALGSGIPLVGVCTLAAMAQASGASHVLSCLDARMGQVYLAAYRRVAEGVEECLPPQLADPSTAPPLPAIPGDTWLACGSGFSAHADLLNARYGNCIGAVQADRFPHARDIARLGAVALAAGQGVSAADAAPLYLRDRVALTIAQRREAQTRP